MKSPIALIRALALRTIGSLRVHKLNEYLLESVVGCLDDPNDYALKTCIVCLQKIFEVSPNLVIKKEIDLALQ